MNNKVTTMENNFNTSAYYKTISLFILIVVINFQILKAQDDTLIYNLKGPAWLKASEKPNSKRIILVTASGTLMYSAALIGLNNLWYADYPRSSFHFFDDSGEWQQIDKCGHTVTPYLEAYYIMNVLRWTGINHKKAAIYAGFTAFMLQNTIEVFDGFSKEWGASLTDVTANFIGASLMTTQELIWGEQRMRLKIQPTFQTYPSGEINDRVNQLYGSSLYVRFIKDYNSMNTWLSINPASFNKEQKILKWLNIAIGYGAGGMYGGYENKWIDKNGIAHDRTDIERYRRIFLSLDVDFTKIKTKSALLKSVFSLFNIVKIPAPTFEYNTKGEFVFHPLM